MSPIQRILDLFRRAYNSLSTNLIDTVKSYIQGTDKPVSSAVLAAFKAIGVTHMLQTATKESIKASYEKAIGKTIPVFPSNLASAWDASGMTLSEKIHGASKEMWQAITDTIRAQLKANNHAITAARALYDGYNSGIAVTRSQSVPRYLDDILDFARHSDLSAADRKIMLMRVRQARKQVDKLAQGGAPNRALKTAYTKLLDAVEDGTDKALDNAIHTAVQEKSRYIAERVARTESARAWAQGFADRYMDDDTVVAFRWKLAARHPRYDICNLYAEADLWGLGKGIYPKDKTPVLPVHPHCLCHLAPIYASELKRKPVDNVEKGGREYIKKLSYRARMQLLGLDGIKSFENGTKWKKLARNYSSQYLKVSRSKSSPNDDIIKMELEKARKKFKQKGSIVYPVHQREWPDYPFDEAHTQGGKNPHSVTEEEARKFIRDAYFVIQRNERSLNYYGKEGAAFVRTDLGLIRTAFKSEQYIPPVQKLIEVYENVRDREKTEE